MTPAPAPPAIDLASVRDAYASAVRAEIAAQKQYPTKAKRLKQEGVVGVTFTVDAAGTLLSVGIATPSPHAMLNDAALEAVRAAAPFLAPPSELTAPLTLALDLRYSLQ